MQVADLCISIENSLSIHSDLHPERAMHCGMLRPDIQDLRVRQSHRFGVLSRPVDDWQIFRTCRHRPLARWKVFSKGIALELGVGQNPPQIRMPLELNTKHIERFS